jgi:hypothetical protein
MNSLLSLVDDALSDPTACARAVRAAGGRVIGFVGTDVPVELIVAADAFPLLLPAQATHRPALRAAAYLEPSFAPLERSIAEQWLGGEFDFVESVVFTRAADSAQRLYYYLCELQRRKLCDGPVPLLYDLAKIPRASSADYAQLATGRLAQALGSDAGRVRTGIEIRNHRRELLRRLQGLRQQPAAPNGTVVERVQRAADRCHAGQFDQALTAWLNLPRPAHSGPRLILAGSAPPDARLHEAVEQAGGLVIAEWGDHALTRLGAPIDCGSDPIKALSSHYHTLPHGPRMFADCAAGLFELVRSGAADGVIFWLLEEEEALVWDLPQQQRALRERCIPMLTLARCRWDIDEAALAAVRDFAAELGKRA